MLTTVINLFKNDKMNQRFLELAEQAGASVSTIGGIFINKTNLDIEKFAQSIVLECVMMADAFELDVNRSGLVYRMKEHFGIEE